MMKKHRFFKAVFAVFSVSFYLSHGALHAQIGSVVASFDGPGSKAAGLAFDGHYLWLSDLSTDRIYRLNPETGQVVQEFPSPDSSPSGLGWDGQYLWCSGNSTDKIYKLSPGNGSVLASFDSPGTAPRGLEFINGALYCQDSGQRLIYKMNPETGAVEETLPAPSGGNRGLAWDGTYLWSVDHSLNEFCQIDLLRKKIVTIIPAPGTYSYGLAFDGEYLWNADYDHNKIYKIKLAGNELFTRYNPQEYTIKYEVVTQNTGSSLMTLKTYLAIPFDSDFQQLLSAVSFLPSNPTITTDDYDQRVAVYTDYLSPGETRRYGWQVSARVYRARYFYLPERVGDFSEIPKSILDTYTQDGSKYDIHNPVIQNAVKEAVGEETNVYWIARNIHDYIISHIEYVNDGHWDDAPQVLRQGHGSCSEYSMTFIAMCRAAGIPACYEAGGHVRDVLPYEDTIYHRWTYIYLPRVGWVPVDCTWDDKKYPANQARYFGGFSNEVFATTRGGGGSQYLSWSYNYRQTYSGGSRTTEKKMTFLPYTSDVLSQPLGQPNRYDLEIAAYPNPFNQECQVLVHIPQQSRGSVKIVDVLGREVVSLWTGSFHPGDHTFLWNGLAKNGLPVSSGIYFLVVTAGNHRASRSVSVIR